MKRSMGRISHIVLVGTAALMFHTVACPNRVEAATQDQIDQARNRGLAWLLTHQNSDGSWRSTPGTEVTATSDALQALAKAQLKNYTYAVGVSWLGAARALSMDSLARKIVTLKQAGMDISSHVQQLKDARNFNTASGGRAWGAYAHFGTTFPDVTLAIAAIRQTEALAGNAAYWDGLFAVLSNQQTGDQSVNGSWWHAIPVSQGAIRYPSATYARSEILPTAQNALEIHAIRSMGFTAMGPYSFTTEIDNSISWLMTKNHADGGVGEQGVSTVFDTALVYEVLAGARPTDSSTGAALDYLIARQSADGSWGGDALQTALVMKVFPSPTAALTDTDHDGIPDAIEMLIGTNPYIVDSRDVLARGNGSGTGILAMPPLVLVGGGSGSSGSGGSSTPDGDLNGDGIVDVADVSLAEQIVSGFVLPTFEQVSHGDVSPSGNPDGLLDVADVERLRRLAVGGQ